MPAEYDALVVGTGPAGSSAALALARAGLRVGVVEKAEPPRYKTCGGGLVGRAAAWLDPTVSYEAERRLLRAEMNLIESGVRVAVEREEPFLSMVMRSEFDHAILRAAREAGARLLAPCEAFGVEQGGERGGNGSEAIALSTDRGRLTTEFVVAADGVNGPLARRAGWLGFPDSIPALEYEIRVTDELQERFAGSARFDFEVGTKGYAWVFPKREHLSVGILAMERGRAQLHQKLHAYLAAIGIDRIESEERHGYLIPVGPRTGGFAKGRVLLAGDAAGLAEPITAEGISYAIKSGQLAAQAVVSGGGDPTRVAAAYERSLDDEILGELRVARRLAKLLYGAPGLRRWLFRTRGKRLGEALMAVFAGEGRFADLVRPGRLLRLALRRS